MSNEALMIAIDPGPRQSGWVICTPDRRCLPVNYGITSNEALRLRLGLRAPWPEICAIEMIGAYGMAVGADIFETCIWIGRFMEAAGVPTALILRREVKLHLCNSVRAKTGEVRQATRDCYEPTGGGKRPRIGTKAQPGPLYGIKDHAWEALAVALTFQRGTERERQGYLDRGRMA